MRFGSTPLPPKRHLQHTIKSYALQRKHPGRRRLTNPVKYTILRIEKVLTAMVSSSSGESVVKNDRLLSEGMSGHFFLPLEIVHVISKVMYTAPPRSVSSSTTCSNVMRHPPLSAFASGEAKSFSSPLARSRKELDHRLCNQHLIAAEAASTAYHKTIRFATKTPPASHLCAAPGACFFCGESSPNVNLHKTLP